MDGQNICRTPEDSRTFGKILNACPLKLQTTADSAVYFDHNKKQTNKMKKQKIFTEAERYKLERLVQQELSIICFHEYGDSPEKIFMQELLKKIKSL